MKIPQTFIPEKNLESKIDSLLKEREKKKEGNFTDQEIDKEAEQLFPNFINYVKNECGPLCIEKIHDNKKGIWFIYQICGLREYLHIGVVTSYVEREGMDTMYGYKADIVIKEKTLSLIYRIGYQYYDAQGKLVSTKSPVRYDTEEIPFP